MADPKPKAGFLQFRKKRDIKGLAKAQAEGSSHVVSSKGKIPNPAGGGMLSKGATVSYTKGTPPSAKVETKRSTTTPTTTTEKNVFLRQDYNEREPGPGKREPQTRTTKASEFSSQYKENPEKAKARVQAQNEGKETYHFKGKHELSGKNVKVKESSVGFQHKATPSAAIKPGTPGSVKVKLPRKKTGDKAFTRKLEKVDYLRGKSGKRYGSENYRKKTESGHGR